jgi:SynChlorMet cassette protein ScmC
MVKLMIQNCRAKTTSADEYLLRLGNGQGWQVSSTAGVRLEVGELGRIMGLKSCKPNGYPKLIFTRRGLGKTKYEETICSLDKDIEVDLRKLGWKVHDLWLVRLWSHDDVPDFICEIRNEEGDYEPSILSMRLSMYPIYQQAQDSGGLPLHAGLVERDGKGVLLAAPRNTGKSSCCRRLPSPWRALCDEETLVVRDDRKQYLAHPFPTWSDHIVKRCEKTWNVQRHVPLTTIFFLEQARIDEVIPIGQGEATVLMNQSAMQACHRFWNNLDYEEVRTRKKRLFDNACALAGSIPMYKLRVSLQGRFWEKIEAVLP